MVDDGDGDGDGGREELKMEQTATSLTRDLPSTHHLTPQEGATL